MSIAVFIVLACTIFAPRVVGVQLTLDPRYEVEWIVSEDRSSVTFKVTAETTGFVGLGFSSNGAMSNADIFIGGVKDNVPYFDDYHGPAVGNGFPLKDTTNNYELIKATENETHTYLEFSRDVETCDSEDMSITNAGLRLIWAIGASDELAQHKPEDRGTKSVYILDPEVPSIELDKLEQEDIVVKIGMPKQATTYWCTMHQLPEFNGTRQMIAYEPIFKTDDSKKYAHHMNVLRCEIRGDFGDSFYEKFKYPGDPGQECNNSPIPMETCVFLEYGWALGGELAVNPPDVGFPFKSRQYYKLEVHLNNPENKEGVEVEVGFRIYHTDIVQKIEGSLLMVSAPTNYQLMVPPNSTEFVSTAHCMPQCLDFDDFPPEGVTAYNAFLHAHTSARKMRIRHYRNGKELPWIINDENYDFNYQTNRRLPEPVTIMRGDQITAECVYDTHWKGGKSVIGGSSTDDEMCMVFIAYYPKIPLFVGCYDWMDKRNMFKILGVERVAPEGKDPIVLSPPELNGTKFSEVVEKFNWTPEARKEYQWQHQYGDHVTACLPRIQALKGGYPENVVPYQPKDMCASEDVTTNSSPPGEEGPTTDDPNSGTTVFSSWITFTPLLLIKYLF